MTGQRPHALGQKASAATRVGEAWRALGPHARAFHRTELARDIESLRLAVETADAAAPRRRLSPRERQYLRVLASTY